MQRRQQQKIGIIKIKLYNMFESDNCYGNSKEVCHGKDNNAYPERKCTLTGMVRGTTLSVLWKSTCRGWSLQTAGHTARRPVWTLADIPQSSQVESVCPPHQTHRAITWRDSRASKKNNNNVLNKLRWKTAHRPSKNYLLKRTNQFWIASRQLKFT